MTEELKIQQYTPSNILCLRNQDGKLIVNIKLDGTLEFEMEPVDAAKEFWMFVERYAKEYLEKTKLENDQLKKRIISLEDRAAEKMAENKP